MMKETKANKVRDLPETKTMTAELKGVNINRGTVCYKSTLLNKIFDNYDELVKAEEEYEKINAEKIKQAEEKKLKAKQVDDALKHAMQVRKDANKMIVEADEAFYKLKDAFIKDYGYYHFSSSEESDGVVVKSLFDFFNW